MMAFNSHNGWIGKSCRSLKPGTREPLITAMTGGLVQIQKQMNTASVRTTVEDWENPDLRVEGGVTRRRGALQTQAIDL